MASCSSVVMLEGSFGTGRADFPSKKPHRRFADIASRNRTVKMAQFDPSGSRRGMFCGSCSIAGVGAGGGGAGLKDEPLVEVDIAETKGLTGNRGGVNSRIRSDAQQGP